jgi:hypothetical protein
MEQPISNQNAPAQKKSGKAWIIVVVILLVLCICCLLPVAGGAGLLYLAPDMVKEYVPEDTIKSLEKELGPILEEVPALVDEGTSSNEAAPQEGETSSNGVPTQKEMEETISKMGFAEIPFEITEGEGMRIIKKAAFVAPDADDPEISDLYLLLMLQSDSGVIRTNMPYTLYCFDSSDEFGPLESKNGDYVWAAIPIGQDGVFEKRKGMFASWRYPVKMEATIESMEAPEHQATIDKLNDTSLPNPYFTVVSSEFNAEQLPNGFYNITAKGKYINNLPIINYAQGLFILYDENDQIISFMSSNWENTMYDLADPNGEGELSATLPYPIAVKPTRVEFIPYPDTGSATNLQNIK